MTHNTIENQEEILNQATESQENTVDQTAENATTENLSETTEVTTVEAETATVEAIEEAVAAEPVVKKHSAPVHNPDDFDWSMDKAGFGSYNESDSDDLKLMYANTIKKIEEKTLVTGRIVSMDSENALIDIGYKSDGLVPLTEFRDNPNLKAGDEVEVFVDETENSLGQLILSRKKAIQEGAWDKIIALKDSGQIVSGYIQTRTKGGLVVDVMGIDAFLPGSQIDVKPVRDYDQYVGKTMDFKIVKINDVFKNVVISHKAIIEDDIEAQKAEMISKLEVGQILEGVVKNMTSFGVFVDLGGLDGLLHITDISWGRINHPEDVLELDQKIQVAVLEFDDDKKRISLGMKQLTPHPWESLTQELNEGSKVKGKVVTVADYGAFIEIQPGIEGLIHVSEMSWSQHLRNPTDFLKVGDEIEAVVLDMDKDQHKLSLGIKQLTEDPWKEIELRYPVESKHTGIVRNLTNYGLFIELEQGVDGLVHVSDLSWSKKIKHPAEFTKKGEELEVIVLEIDRENRRLSLGHKQLDENPWDTFSTIFQVGTDHEATVTEVNDRGALVSMPYGVEAFVPTKHMKKEDGTNIAVDDVLQFRVIEFGKDAKRILVSHTDIWKQLERQNRGEERNVRKRNENKTSEYVHKMNENVERNTLGDFDVLANLKAKMDSDSSTAKAKETKAKAVVKEEKVIEEKPVSEVVVEAVAEEVSAEETAELTAEEIATKTSELLNIIGAAEEGKVDDLKVVSGIGPVYEKKLNELGIFTYAQLSKLTPEGVTLLEQLTKFPGRVERENWIGQATELAK